MEWEDVGYKYSLTALRDTIALLDVDMGAFLYDIGGNRGKDVLFHKYPNYNNDPSVFLQLGNSEEARQARELRTLMNGISIATKIHESQLFMVRNDYGFWSGADETILHNTGKGVSWRETITQAIKLAHSYAARYPDIRPACEKAEAYMKKKYAQIDGAYTEVKDVMMAHRQKIEEEDALAANAAASRISVDRILRPSGELVATEMLTYRSDKMYKNDGKIFFKEMGGYVTYRIIIKSFDDKSIYRILGASNYDVLQKIRNWEGKKHISEYSTEQQMLNAIIEALN